MIYSNDKDGFFTRKYPEDKKGLFRGITIAALQIAQNKIDIDMKTEMNKAFFQALTSNRATDTWLKKLERLKCTENGTIQLTEAGIEEINKSYDKGDNMPYGTSKGTVKKVREAMLNGSEMLDFLKKISKSECYAK
ncbi:MAG: hypothetical protein ACPG5B_12285 [Chitinophagales bacterium]